MSTFKKHIDISSFSVQNIDTSELDDIIDWLPKNGVFDLNIAEQGLVRSLQAENTCQEMIAKLDRHLGVLEGEKSKAWAYAALKKAKDEGYKTAKDKEWFASADDDYIEILNNITIAKAAKKGFENKASYFRSWHYAFKTFLKRDYSLERLGNTSEKGYNIGTLEQSQNGGGSQDFGGDPEW